MSYPTAAQLDAMARTLSAAPWTRLVARTLAAIERDRRGGPNLPDGYPTTTLPGGSSGSELTSVEAAVVARTRPQRDEHHDRTVNAVGYAQDILLALAAWSCQLDRLEARVAHIEPEIGCTHHARHNLFAPATGRKGLCRDCYDFNLRYGRPPPAKLLDAKERGIRWTTATIEAALKGTL
jgi:hypothetical protein